eukprot:jgi/Undpi1/3092/HiC_scaffold_15.g06466.m1
MDAAIVGNQRKESRGGYYCTVLDRRRDGGRVRQPVHRHGRETWTMESRAVRGEQSTAEKAASRGDVTIPAGKVFFAIPVWGGQLSRKGLVTVRQKRWLVREESRILGVCATERIDVNADGVAHPRTPRTRKPPFASGFKD